MTQQYIKLNTGAKEIQQASHKQGIVYSWRIFRVAAATLKY